MMIKKNLLKNPPNNLKKTISFIVKKKDAGKRLDTFLTQKKKLSRNFIQKEIKKNHILVNNLFLGGSLKPPAKQESIITETPFDSRRLR